MERAPSLVPCTAEEGQRRRRTYGTRTLGTNGAEPCPVPFRTACRGAARSSRRDRGTERHAALLLAVLGSRRHPRAVPHSSSCLAARRQHGVGASVLVPPPPQPASEDGQRRSFTSKCPSRRGCRPPTSHLRVAWRAEKGGEKNARHAPTASAEAQRKDRVRPSALPYHRALSPREARMAMGRSTNGTAAGGRSHAPAIDERAGVGVSSRACAGATSAARASDTTPCGSIGSVRFGPPWGCDRVSLKKLSTHHLTKIGTYTYYHSRRWMVRRPTVTRQPHVLHTHIDDLRPLSHLSYMCARLRNHPYRLLFHY